MKIGILGAGQLGRMLALSGFPLDFDFVFFDPATEACAAPLGEHIHADYTDEASLAEFCAQVDIATFEFENVPDECAQYVAARVPLFPDVKALSSGQDRLDEKQMFDALHIPVPPYRAINSEKELEQAVADIGAPCVLKTRRLGYDGKGQVVIKSADECAKAWKAIGGQPLILESFIRFEREVSLISVRAKNGDTAFYPLSENVHRDGILRNSTPTQDDPMQAEAQTFATRVLDHLAYCGVMAFEFFVTAEGLLANEIAPRVHNSGHWTIEGAVCSQFENHLRAITGLPLGSTELREKCAMVNLLGSAPPLDRLTQIEGVHVHLYGKTPKPQRKIGHITVTAADMETVELRVRKVEALLA